VDRHLLHVSALTQRYGKDRGLENVSFGLDSGVVALVGVNGAGKSTLLRTLAGAQRPSEGSVTLDGLDPYGRQRSAALSRSALMPQTNEFPKNLTAEEVVASIAWFKGIPARQARAKARDALARVGLEKRMDVRMGRLSGGMARRVALAQALVSDPDVLLLDEPSTGLDPEQRRAMIALVRSVSARIVIFSSHVMEDVEEVAADVLVLDEGRLVHESSLGQLQARGARAAASAAGSRAEMGFLDVLANARSRARA
jgi:ABC-2 type transport system ATP-binding protein